MLIHGNTVYLEPGDCVKASSIATQLLVPNSLDPPVITNIVITKNYDLSNAISQPMVLTFI